MQERLVQVVARMDDGVQASHRVALRGQLEQAVWNTDTAAVLRLRIAGLEGFGAGTPAPDSTDGRDVSGLGADVDAVVDDLEALRRALEEISASRVPGP